MRFLLAANAGAPRKKHVRAVLRYSVSREKRCTRLGRTHNKQAAPNSHSAKSIMWRTGAAVEQHDHMEVDECGSHPGVCPRAGPIHMPTTESPRSTGNGKALIRSPSGKSLSMMPSVEWFEEQSREYRESVMPPSLKARVAVEAGIGLTWYRYVGDHGRIVSLEHFGASADAKTLFAENVVAAAKAVLARTTRPDAVHG